MEILIFLIIFLLLGPSLTITFGKPISHENKNKPKGPPPLKFKRTDDQEERYCIECGSEDLAYVERYANGYEWNCRVCGHSSIFQSNDTDE